MNYLHGSYKRGKETNRYNLHEKRGFSFCTVDVLQSILTMNDWNLIERMTDLLISGLVEWLTDKMIFLIKYAFEPILFCLKPVPSQCEPFHDFHHSVCWRLKHKAIAALSRYRSRVTWEITKGEYISPSILLRSEKVLVKDAHWWDLRNKTSLFKWMASIQLQRQSAHAPSDSTVNYSCPECLTEWERRLWILSFLFVPGFHKVVETGVFLQCTSVDLDFAYLT